MRCIGFALAGFFGVGRAPHHRDFYCWMHGRDALAGLVIFVAVSSIFGAGFIVGRYL